MPDTSQRPHHDSASVKEHVPATKAPPRPASAADSTSPAAAAQQHTSPPPSSQPSSPVAEPSTKDAPEHKPPLKGAKGSGTVSKGKGKETTAQASPGENGPSTTSANPSGASNPNPKKRPSTRDLHLNQYVTRDHLHAAAIYSQEQAANGAIRQKRREIEYYTLLRRERAVNPGAVFGPGYSGYGNGYTEGKGRVLYPCQRKRPGGRKAGELRLSRTQLQKQADQPEMLVPVRLDVEYDKIKLRDTFTWNMHDHTIPLGLFAEQLVEDFHLPMNQQLISMVQNAVKEQVTDYHPHVYLADEPLDPTLPYVAYKNDDMRVLIKLNITIGRHNLIDQFEWDINNPLNSPEEFAQQLSREMSLSGEFTTAIAHSIREQCQLFTKALFVTGHPFDGRPIEDEDVRSAMLQSPLPSIFRPANHIKDFSPTLFELSEQDLERAEKIGAREDRRLKRRVNRRGGPTVPDLKEMPKTHRSQIVSSMLPGAVAKLSDLEKTRTTKQIKDGDSEEEESESGEEDTPEKVIPGYANMTRRQRMSAMNSLKTSTGRSATPEVHQLAQLGRHEPVQSSNLRQQAVPPPPPKPQWERRPDLPSHQDSLLVKLSISVQGMRAFLQTQQRRDAMKAAEEQQKQQQQQEAQKAQQQMAPPQTPSQVGMKHPQAATSASTSSAAPQTSSTSTPAPSTPTQVPNPAPSPPEWLTQALNALRAGPIYANDRFEGTMRYTAFDAATDAPIPAGQQAQAQADGKQLVFKYQPRIRCLDCPGKLYTTGPDQTVENFLMHLKNRDHRKRVDARLAKEAAAGGSH